MRVDLFSIGKFTVHTYGLMIAVGIILCTFMGYARAKKKGLRPETVIDIVIIAVILGFIGAKLLFVLISFRQFLQEPLRVLGSSGFVVYGGIVVGVLAVMIYCRIKKIVFLQYFDLLVPSLSLAQAFGRIGCFFAGCCYGKETDAAFGVVFPAGSFAPAGVPLIPTQLMSSAGDFAIMAALLWFSRKPRRTGDTGALYLMLYGIGRFCIEFFRQNEQGGIGALTTAQLFSIVFVIASLLLFWYNRNGRKKKTAEPEDEEQPTQTCPS